VSGGGFCCCPCTHLPSIASSRVSIFHAVPWQNWWQCWLAGVDRYSSSPTLSDSHPHTRFIHSHVYIHFHLYTQLYHTHLYTQLYTISTYTPSFIHLPLTHRSYQHNILHYGHHPCRYDPCNAIFKHPETGAVLYVGNAMVRWRGCFALHAPHISHCALHHQQHAVPYCRAVAGAENSRALCTRGYPLTTTPPSSSEHGVPQGASMIVHLFFELSTGFYVAFCPSIVSLLHQPCKYWPSILFFCRISPTTFSDTVCRQPQEIN